MGLEPTYRAHKTRALTTKLREPGPDDVSALEEKVHTLARYISARDPAECMTDARAASWQKSEASTRGISGTTTCTFENIWLRMSTATFAQKNAAALVASSAGWPPDMRVHFSSPVATACLGRPRCAARLKKGRGPACRGLPVPGSLFCANHASRQAEVEAEGYVHVGRCCDDGDA